jgi:hypothetical protein
MKLVWLIAVIASVLVGPTASAVPGPWEQPAANLAEQIAEILGPGQARLTIQNLSTIPTDQIPVVRLLLEQDLKTRGVAASGAESANTIRVTLSENVRERLWVAEVVEGNQSRVAMVRVDRGTAQQAQQTSDLTLRKQTILITSEAVLAMSTPARPEPGKHGSASPSARRSLCRVTLAQSSFPRPTETDSRRFLRA